MASSQLIIERLKKLPFINTVDYEDAITRTLDACQNTLCSMNTSPQLQWLSSYEGLLMLTGKLSDSLRNRWRTYGIQSTSSSGKDPTLQVYVAFLQIIYKEAVDDFFKRPYSTLRDVRSQRPGNRALRTEGISNGNVSNPVYCQLHSSDKHDLKNCKAFGNLPKDDKLKLVKDNKLCFRCLGNHFVSNCNISVPRCDVCQKNHLTIMHYSNHSKKRATHNTASSDSLQSKSDAKVALTNVNETYDDDSVVFSKTLLVEVSHPNSNKMIKCLAILDDQSNRCFADPRLLNLLDVSAPYHSYSVETLNGLSVKEDGYLISGLRVRDVNGQNWYSLPKALSSNLIPDTRH